MDKYIEALNSISSYEIWHECTYDDGYSNFDDWIEYPFEDDEDIKLLSGLITKHNTLNKGIDELIKWYEKDIEERNKRLIFFETYKDERMQDISNQAIFDDKQFIEKLKKLKGE